MKKDIKTKCKHWVLMLYEIRPETLIGETAYMALSYLKNLNSNIITASILEEEDDKNNSWHVFLEEGVNPYHRIRSFFRVLREYES